MDKSHLYTVVVIAAQENESSKLAACNLFANSEGEVKQAALEKAKETFPQSDGFTGYCIYAYQVISLDALKKAAAAASGLSSFADDDSVLDADMLNL